MVPTDFLLLYQELGLRPDSGIDELKLAYRRRIADLHPDRQRGSDAGDVAEERLQRLTRLYGAATTFHRQHGRLPGASAPVRGRDIPSSAPTTSAPERGRRTRLLAVSLLVAGVGCLIWLNFDSGDAEPPQRAEAIDEEAAPPAVEATSSPALPDESTPRLKVGMRMDDVLEIEKEPITRGYDRWDYGPSWIAFDRGKVADWYSSPLRPLRHASTHPRPHALEPEPR